MLYPLKIFPFRHGNARLSENGPQKMASDVASMGIRNPNAEIAFGHELMFPARRWTTKPKLVEAVNQGRSGYGSKARSGNFLDG